MIFSLLLSLLLVLMSVFINSLFYVIALVFVVVVVVFFCVFNYMIQTVTGLILIIVYVGAMMILIGYICAVCPNIITKSNFSYVFYKLVSFLLCLFWLGSFTMIFDSTDFFLVDFFYSYNGLFCFFLVVFMLFVSLLMVTSPLMAPKGPFRSVN